MPFSTDSGILVFEMRDVATVYGHFGSPSSSTGPEVAEGGRGGRGRGVLDAGVWLESGENFAFLPVCFVARLFFNCSSHSRIHLTKKGYRL